MTKSREDVRRQEFRERSAGRPAPEETPLSELCLIQGCLNRRLRGRQFCSSCTKDIAAATRRSQVAALNDEGG